MTKNIFLILAASLFFRISGDMGVSYVPVAHLCLCLYVFLILLSF